MKAYRSEPLLATPANHTPHELRSQTAPAVGRLGVHIEYPCPARVRIERRWLETHDGHATACDDAILILDEPASVGAVLESGLDERPSCDRHGFALRFIAVAHVGKHIAA